MLIALAVRLVIPDTTALTAQRALERLGLSDLAELRREVGWEFLVDPDAGEAPGALAGRLGTADVLVNQNTQRARWWAGPLEEAAAGFTAGGGARRWAGLLVEERDDPAPSRMGRLLTARLGFRAVEPRRRATLWWLGADGGTDPESLAARAGELLLANPHGQRAALLGPRPSPLGGRLGAEAGRIDRGAGGCAY